MEADNQPKVTLIKKESKGGPYEIFEFRVEGAPRREHRHVDVLLIHGLTGHSIKTWGGSLDKENIVSDCWPRKLAIELQSQATFWTLGYAAPSFNKQLGTIPTSIKQQGGAVLQELAGADLGTKPIIFVNHSLGGLLAKAILAKSAEADRFSPEGQILDQTNAVIFASTPHAGSVHARWRFAIPVAVDLATKGIGGWLAAVAAGILLAGPTLTVSVLGRTWQMSLFGLVISFVILIVGAWWKSQLAPGRHVLLLDPSNPDLRDLIQDFRRIRSQRTFFTDSFYEEKRLWGLFLVVPWWSADPGVTDCAPVGIAANHIRICKHPHAKLLQHRVRERVNDACRGKTISVFSDKLNPLMKEDRVRNAFRVLFRGEQGDRGRAEENFRTFLREKMKQAEFVPKSAELGLALKSEFDEDGFVWNLWHEQTLASDLRHLRRKAAKEVENDYRPAQDAGSDPTLIPFYRSLRMIEHICSGDLNDPGYERRDRDLLLALIGEASEKLDGLCQGNETLDTNGTTRRLLLRLSCMFRGIRAADEYVGKGPMEKRGAELAGILKQWRTAFDEALKEFREKLNL